MEDMATKRPRDHDFPAMKRFMRRLLVMETQSPDIPRLAMEL